ncbi:MAG: hypothetical protein AB7I27_14680 [Bacteriovoracaceae bacterium]
MKNWTLSIKLMLLSLFLLMSTACKNSSPSASLPEINGVKGPFFNLVDGKVLITWKLLNVNLSSGGKAMIPDTRESSLEISPNLEDGGTMVVFHLDLEDLRTIDIHPGDPTTLPDGRPIPGIPGGELKDGIRLDGTYHSMPISFYYHKKLFGIYMPFDFNTRGLAGYWPISINSKDAGLLGIVASDSSHKAGGILFLRLDALKDRQFNRLINLSKRYPNRVF